MTLNSKIITKNIIFKKNNIINRPPIVCVLGHVDHGKTTLLDAIRKTETVNNEKGGITQHIAAYQIYYKNNPITFIDTPGHSAFFKMRERGINITDIAILVVAADDGFMPQTKEALDFAIKAKISIIVAINKIDSERANIEMVKQQMQSHGIMPEDWGGDTLYSTISAKNKHNIENLLELIILQSEINEYKANIASNPKGIILESQLRKGQGPISTIILQEGILRIGNIIVANNQYCKIKSIINCKGKNINIV